MRYAVEEHDLSERRACRLLNVSRTGYRYRPKRPDDGEIREQLGHLAERWPRWGYHKMRKWIRKQGHPWNHKRIYRVYCEMNLNMRVKPKKRLPSREPQKLAQPEAAGLCWSLDFIEDRLENGRKFRVLNVLDDFNRETLWAEVNFSITSLRVIHILELLTAYRGYPKRIRSDNGSEFIAKRTKQWADEHHVTLDYIEPGKPTQNGYVERFHRTYREDVLDMYLFRSLEEVRRLTEEWRYRYNTERPHDALHDMTPVEYALAAHHSLAAAPA